MFLPCTIISHHGRKERQCCRLSFLPNGDDARAILFVRSPVLTGA